ncbi:MAG: hypothetical protein EON95_17175 [Caulobacteraceae bacterium]|nr:hypothetical protein [Caulobacter sp.]RYF90320.1 MAG: hypothetical protein EON95_17175 [Caulobacteraceae bacterium]
MTRGLKGRDRRDKRQRAILLGLLTVGWLATLPFGAVGALFSPLVFDHRPNLLNPMAWIAFLLMIAFWIVCIIAPFVAWVTWNRNQERYAWLAIAVPAVWLTALVVALQFVPG